MANENAIELAHHLAGLLGVPTAPVAMALNYAINCGPEAVELFFSNLAEYAVQLRSVCLEMSEQRMAARANYSAEAKAEIEMLEMWMDIPAYGRDV